MPTKSKFTDSVRRGLLESLAEGNSRNTAAALNGIDPATLSRWLSRGQQASRGSQFRAFSEEVAMAEAAARGRALRILNRHMQDQPKWAAWFLERRDPAFAPPPRFERQIEAEPLEIRLLFSDGTLFELPTHRPALPPEGSDDAS
jgi:transposase-like protein